MALMPQKLRMLEKAVQQGCSERRCEAYASARRGWAGEKRDFFSVLIGNGKRKG
jgi:hypothetical protein